MHLDEKILIYIASGKTPEQATEFFGVSLTMVEAVIKKDLARSHSLESPILRGACLPKSDSNRLRVFDLLKP